MQTPNIADARVRRTFAALIAILIIFAALARGAHDIWAATLVYVAILAISVAFLIYAHWLGDRKGCRFPLIFSGSLVAAAMFLSFRGSVNPSESFLGFMDWCAALLLFFLAANVFIEKSLLDLFLKIFPPCFWIQTFFALRQLSQSAFHPLPEIGGTLVNANLQAAFLLLWIPVLVDRFLDARNQGPGLMAYWLSGLLACIVNLFLTQSAWALVCLLVILPWLIPIARRASFKKILWGLFLLVAAAVLYYKIVMDPIGRVSERILWWKAALRMFCDHPIFGIGVGNFPSAYLAYKVGPGENTLFAHSFPLMLLAETGLVGTVAAGTFFLMWFLGTVPHNFQESERRPFYWGVTLFLLFTAISLGTEYLVNLLTLAVFLGVGIATSQPPLRRLRNSIVILVAGCAVGALPFLILPFFASRFYVDGESYLAEEKWDLARASFLAAVQLDSRAWEAYEGLARVAQLRGDLPQAVAFLQKAIERNKLNPDLKKELDQRVPYR